VEVASIYYLKKTLSFGLKFAARVFFRDPSLKTLKALGQIVLQNSKYLFNFISPTQKLPNLNNCSMGGKGDLMYM